MSLTVELPTAPEIGRWRRYPRYKDSGVAWIGEIPEQWSRVQLRRVFRVLNGSTPKSSEPSYWNGDLLWVTPEDLGSLTGREITSTSRMITEAGYQSCGTHLAPPGSLVLSTRAPIGHLAIAGNALCTNQGCRTLMHLHDNYSRSFFFYMLLSAMPELQSWGQGTTFLELAASKLEEFYLVVPSVDEQRRIADFLDREIGKIDALIEKKERLVALLLEKRAALISRAVTKGLDASVPMKASGVSWIGEIPAHWKAMKIKRFCQVRRGASPRPIENPIYFAEDGEYAWVRISDVTASARYLLTTEQRLSKIGQSKSVCLEPGELFLSIAATVGKPIITKIKCCIHDGFVYFTNLKQNREYLYYIFSGGELYTGLGKMGTQLNLNTDTIGDIHVPVPPLAEQEAIVAYLEREVGKIDALITTIREGIEKLKEYSTALISAAVTGKIDIREETGHGCLGEES